MVVRAYFSHHQGMSLVALANAVCHDVFVTRFHSDPRIQATELLLQERVPREAILSEPRPAETATAPPSLPVYASRRFVAPDTPIVHTHFLSNGRYTVAVTQAGGGYSQWKDISVTRRREDPTLDPGAQYIYLRDPWSGRLWSATYQPVCEPPDSFEAIFDLDKVTFRRRDLDIETRLDVTVSSEDDVEVRRLTLTEPERPDPRSRGDQLRRDRAGAAARRLRAPRVRQAVHRVRVRPAERRPAVTRRPRGRRRVDGRGVSRARASTARAGRRRRMGNRSRAFPRTRPHAGQSAVARRPRVVGHDGARCSTRSAHCASASGWRRAPPVRVLFATGVAADRAVRLALARKYRDRAAAARAFSMAFTHVHITLQHLGLSDEEAILFDRLASRVFGADNSLVSPSDLAANRYGQQNLWGKDISGRPADRARPCRGPGDAAAGAAAAQRAGILAREGAARGARHPERAEDRLPGRDAPPPDGAAAGGALERMVRQTGRDLPVAGRGDGARPICICWRGGTCRPARGFSATLASQLERPAAVAATTSTTCRAPPCSARQPRRRKR
jgi:cyclic beta-1,2-glucan synthetase